MIPNAKRTAVALGSFDGLHRGHMSVLDSAAQLSRQGLEPVVLLFDVHPDTLIHGKAPTQLLQNDKRNEIIASLGIKIAVVEFELVYKLQCGAFFKDILLKKLNAGAICCGWNYRFGFGGKGTSETLRELCNANGVELEIAGSVDYEGEPISSTRIRRAIESGEIKAANAMLGRPFLYKYTVVSGDRRGRLIGAPTINQHFDPSFTVPKLGVYASVATVDGKEYIGVTNIGLRPTFDNTDLRSETCILDFSADVYGRDIEVKLLDYLRAEQKFDTVELLSSQIRADAAKSREIFAMRGENGCV